MSRQINIGLRSPDVQNDIAYRYKMDPLQTKIEGRGNGIKTVLMNMSQVAASMRVEPKYVTKYLGIEFGAQSKWDNKRGVGIVNGQHPSQEMQNAMFGFIETFVLCPSCHLPELVHKVKKSAVGAKCYSCGWVGALRSQHAVMKYVTKNPPAKKAGLPSNAMTKKQKRLERERKRQMKKEGDGNTSNSSREVEEVPEDVFGNLDDWHMDDDDKKMHEERAIQKEMDEQIRENYSREAPDTPVALMKFILERPNIKLIDIVSEFDRIKIAHKLEQQEVKLGKVLVDAVFDFTQGIELVKECIEKHNMLLGWYASEDTRALILISYIEDAIVTHDFWKETAIILEAFYDAGVLEEGFIMKWFDNPPEMSYVVQDPEDITQLKEHAEPFIDWIKSVSKSDEDSGDAEFDEDGEETAI